MKFRFLMIFYVVGILFRIWFIALSPQPFVYDQYVYRAYAMGIVTTGIIADVYRLYGYPLIIAPIFYFFGFNEMFAWKLLQAMIDTGTGILIFLIAQKLFTKKTALLACILYLFNPFTSAYVGVLLSEVVTIFWLTFIFYLLIIILEKKNVRILALLSLVLGFLPHIRQTFSYYVFMLFGIILYYSIKTFKLKARKLQVIVIGLIFFFIPFIYTLVGNLRYFNEFKLLSVGDVLPMQVYISQFIERGLPNTDGTYLWPSQVTAAWDEYFTPTDRDGRAKLSERYWNLSIENIKKSPEQIVLLWTRKMWYVWEKHFLFPYVNRLYYPSDIFVYWGNFGLIVFAILGIMRYLFENNSKERNKIFIFSALFFFIYISVVHIFSTSEERFSLPAYPLLILFSAYSMYSIKNYLAGKKNYEIKK